MLGTLKPNTNREKKKKRKSLIYSMLFGTSVEDLEKDIHKPKF